MIINDILNKIKSKYGIDVTTFLCFCVIILVGLGSFGLGRLSMVNTDNNPSAVIEGNNQGLKIVEAVDNKKIEGNTSIDSQNTKEKMYVASKNGKLYYSIGCAGAKRISEANKVWFASVLDAEKSGYSLSTSCK